MQPVRKQAKDGAAEMAERLGVWLARLVSRILEEQEVREKQEDAA